MSSIESRAASGSRSRAMAGPFAQLTPLRNTALTREVLIAHRRSLPAVDPAAMRREIDDHIDTSL
jgi:hypothetical protein